MIGESLGLMRSVGAGYDSATVVLQILRQPTASRLCSLPRPAYVV
jgi:hypothetical protein